MAGSRQSLEGMSGRQAASKPTSSSGGKGLTSAQKVKVAVAAVCIVVGGGLTAYYLGAFDKPPPTVAPPDYNPAAGAPEGASEAQKQRMEELQRMREAAKARGQPIPEGGS